MALLSGQEQGCEATVILDAGISPAQPNQHLHNLQVAIVAGCSQGCNTIGPAEIHVDGTLRLLRQVELDNLRLWKDNGGNSWLMSF